MAQPRIMAMKARAPMTIPAIAPPEMAEDLAAGLVIEFVTGLGACAFGAFGDGVEVVPLVLLDVGVTVTYWMPVTDLTTPADVYSLYTV